ncbi:TetR/AcrR family transcriptional regulator [Paenibacillus physcomitrellae]|uniref:TetR family transcriptional regulator n=1 Tax=Paenibacillus physcomitrellae TaxID=1619311 RepID=A0ABQ1GEW0_9BACL|nr:TetR/AcrR family transcriptional regulator [Paenibacillus physcomitrellae]GGA42321.1 TetR family transcriptional regulator [Paenibacillus physcomitrellae]
MQIQKEEVRDAILEAAANEFHQYGYAEASMRRIAKSAGMTTGNIYRYFSGKEELFDAIVGPIYSQYSSYAGEYLQTVDLHVGSEVRTTDDFWRRVEDALVGLLKASGTGLMLLLCRSEGSKYESIKQEITLFSETLLLKQFAAAKPARSLSNYEQREVKMINATLIEGIVLIIRDNPEPKTLGLLVDRLIAVYCSGIDQLLEEYKEREGENHHA